MLVALVALAVVQAPVKKVLVIGIDGCRPDALLRAETPNIDALVADGCWGVGKADPLSNSGPGWSSVLCGVSAKKHGVTDNTFSGANFREYPDFLSVAERERPSLRTVTLASWKPVIVSVVSKVDYEGPQSGEGDEAAVFEARSALRSGDPDLMFVQLEGPDVAGHAFGFGPQVSEYIKSIEDVDSYIGVLLNNMRARDTFAKEDWLVILISDHGGSEKGHGQATVEHMNVPFIVSGRSVSDAFSVVPTLNDVAPTVFAHLGLRVPDDVDWDGVPVGLAGFDSLARARARDVNTVYFDKPSGFYLGKLTLKLSVAPGLEIRVTTDGTLPNAKSLIVQEAVFDSDVLVRARAFRDGRPAGPSSFAAYQVQSSLFPPVDQAGSLAGLRYWVAEEASGLDRPETSGVAGSPSPLVVSGRERSAVRFEGIVQVSTDGIYQFAVRTEGHAKLDVGGRTVFGPGSQSSRVGLKAGWHRLSFEVEFAGPAKELRLFAGVDGGDLAALGNSAFRHFLKSNLAESHRPYWSR